MQILEDLLVRRRNADFPPLFSPPLSTAGYRYFSGKRRLVLSWLNRGEKGPIYEMVAWDDAAATVEAPGAILPTGMRENTTQDRKRGRLHLPGQTGEWEALLCQVQAGPKKTFFVLAPCIGNLAKRLLRCCCCCCRRLSFSHLVEHDHGPESPGDV